MIHQVLVKAMLLGQTQISLLKYEIALTDIYKKHISFDHEFFMPVYAMSLVGRLCLIGLGVKLGI